ncbi:ABC transporter permease [Paenibacillus naphthalenovorans]|uniref:ABC transporter permease n=1 Tax=Paenibacillus naphthalenovorans TaxID=162209 RepID=UPI000881BF33|nr:ABC transporter permease [Paenibacillus naphthalenovorans]SDJ30231.1 NitT/TauT family transport system permease protein [Paenibacillus naphthalenovorans]
MAKLESLKPAAASPVPAKKSKLTPAWSYPLVTIAIILLVWEICGQIGMIDPFMFSWPSKILVQTWGFIMNGSVFRHLAISGLEAAIGLAMAMIGIPLGLVLGYWKKLEYSFDPIITALYTTPVVALTPLFVLWFGLDILSKIMMVFTMAVFPILINTMSGVKTTDPSLIKAARSYGANEFQMFKEVIFPSTLSYIITGIRLAIGRALIAVVVAEMLAANKGIGYAIRHASELFRTAEYLGYVGVLMVFSVLLTQLLKVVERKIAPWRS